MSQALLAIVRHLRPSNESAKSARALAVACLLAAVILAIALSDLGAD